MSTPSARTGCSTGAGRPGSAAPVEVLLHAFRDAAKVFEAGRPFSEPRLGIIAETPTLRERELAEHALLVDALADALRHRGVGGRLADLAARTGWAAFQHAADA